MRTYVSTLGFHAERVTRPVIKRGIDAGDEVVVVRPAIEGDDDRAGEAVDHIRSLLREVEPGATVAIERVGTDEFPRAVLDCSDVLRAAEGDLVVNLGGGAREVFLPLTIATLLHAPLVHVALQYRDVDEQVREWPVPDLTTAVPESTWPVLSALGTLDASASLPELQETSGKSKSTVARWVEDLDRAGLVDTWKEHRTKHVELTVTGRLLLRAR